MSESSGREVVVTGLSALTALGPGVEAFFGGLLAGRVAIRPVTGFDASRYQAREAAEIEGDFLDPLEERGTALALAAAAEALASCPEFGGPRSGIAVGTSLGGNRAWSERLAGDASTGLVARSTLSHASHRLARSRGVEGPVSTLSVACASGTAAIGLGADWIRRNEVDRVLCGGYDALSEFVFAGFDSLRALSRTAARPFDRRRDGLLLGEGAGLLLLESREAAEARGAPILAVVRGYGSSSDAHHMTRPPSSGEGLTRAIDAALLSAGAAASEIDLVSAHGTATVFNDLMEASAFRKVLGERVTSVPVSSIKGAIGHTLGAAGALEAVLCVLSLVRGETPPTAGCEEVDESLGLDVIRGTPRRGTFRTALSTSAAFGGTNAALLLGCA